MKKENTISREFTLPFVGREEELQFLLNEYDQMLHAQYRSVWIEAPAGMGKTTLVEEFLKRISVPDGDHLQDGLHLLRPWIVHAHLRERSSNSLASFVEALGVTLQTLTEAQREKLFSGLTSFYQERARRIVGGGNVQSVDMEEAITAAGYILKQLSKYFPLVVIIEDIHVLKGEMSFYALRHLQAIIEQVPVLTMFISRPSEEKYLKQFRELSIKEGSKKYEVKSLKYEDVEHLVGAGSSSPAVGEQVKKLMHLSGGNALLLRELLRSGTLDPKDSSVSTTEQIIHYLTKELERLSKRDRQVISIAGMLGEEFSERLLQEIAESKDFRCWADDVLQRLEKKGIIIRRKKILKPEGEGKEISLQVSVFAHALWWEAARKLYDREKTWTDKKFAETIIPLLSHRDYPLLTDAELIVKLFQWLPKQMSFALLEYIDPLCGTEARWHFHAEEEMLEILAKARRSIVGLMARTKSPFKKNHVDIMVRLLDAEKIITAIKEQTIHIANENFTLMRKLLSQFLDNDRMALEDEVGTIYEEYYLLFHHYADKDALDLAEKALKSLQPLAVHHHLERQHQAYLYGVRACREWYRHPLKAAQLFYKGAQMYPRTGAIADNQVGVFLTKITNLPFSQSNVLEYLLLATHLRKAVTQINDLTISMYASVFAYRAEILLATRAGKIAEARRRCEEFLTLKEKALRTGFQLWIQFAEARVCSVEGERENALKIIQEIFSKLSWHDDTSCLKILANVFLMIEEWGYFEKLWQENKHHLWPRDMPLIIQLMEARLLMCLLLGNDEGILEVNGMLLMLQKKYPMLKEAIKSSEKKTTLFLALKKSSSERAKKEFEKFMNSDDTVGPSDKAFYLQLFARIGVRYGHDPKEFSTYVKNSLEGFIKLKVPKRVIFTAEKFHEAKLISRKELHRIKKKYKVHEARHEAESIPRDQEEMTKYEQQSTHDEHGITLRCVGGIAAFDPNGKEIIDRRWGKREHSPSVYKRIVIELVCARFEGRMVTRNDLLTALHPEATNGMISQKKRAKLDRNLSAYLSHISKAFAPYKILEKVNGEYQLQLSVHVDIEEVKKKFQKIKLLEHLPSRLWAVRTTLNAMSQNVFAAGINTKRVAALRREFTAWNNDCALLLKDIESKIVL